jgi:hypothetical protein
MKAINRRPAPVILLDEERWLCSPDEDDNETETSTENRCTQVPSLMWCGQRVQEGSDKTGANGQRRIWLWWWWWSGGLVCGAIVEVSTSLDTSLEHPSDRWHLGQEAWTNLEAAWNPRSVG